MENKEKEWPRDTGDKYSERKRENVQTGAPVSCEWQLLH